MSLPASSLPATVQVVSQVLSGLEPLVSRAGRPMAARRRASNRTANAGASWTAELRRQLRQAWLAEDQATPADEAVTRLAGAMGRTRYAIRSQLARVNCDPDVPGRELSNGTSASGGTNDDQPVGGR